MGICVGFVRLGGRSAVALALLWLLDGSTPAVAAVLRVAPAGAPFRSIQAAIDAARDGDTIRVASGNYSEPLDFRGKAITVRGAGQSLTVIDGSGVPWRPAVSFHGDETRLSVLRDVSIRGSAVGCVHILSAEPSLVDVTVESCHGYNGGGVTIWARPYVDDTKPLLERVTLAHNTATDRGGGLYVYRAAPLIRGARVLGNVAGTGGGIVLDQTTAIVRNTLVADNRANHAGAILADDWAAGSQLFNVLAIGNRAASSWWRAVSVGHLVNSAIVATGGHSEFDMDIGYNNGLGSGWNALWKASCSWSACPFVAQWAPPGFVKFADDGNFTNDDFRLRTGSAYRNAGAPTLQDDDGSASDIGLYGGPDDVVADTDADGLRDAFERANGLSPSAQDAGLDPDGDGLVNLAEQAAGADPHAPDTDGDGVDDSVEWTDGLDPTDPSDHAPTPRFAPQLYAAVGDEVPLDLQESSDPSGAPMVAYWLLLEAPPTSALSLLLPPTVTPGPPPDPVLLKSTFTPDVVGDYRLQVRVANDRAWSPPAEVTVHVGRALAVPETYGTIQAAIEVAEPYDHVRVGPGTYHERLTVGTVPVRITGAGPDVTVLDGDLQGVVVRFPAGTSAATALEHMTVRRGVNTDANYGIGGCIQGTYAAPTLRHLHVHTCRAAYGGGIGIWGSMPDAPQELSDLLIEECTARDGGGVGLSPDVRARYELARVTVRACHAVGSGGGISLGGRARMRLVASRLLDNSAGYRGGGLEVEAFDSTSGTRVSLEGVTVAGCSAVYGGGVASTAYLFVRNTVVAHNTATYGGGLYLAGTDTLENTLFLANGASTGGHLYVPTWGDVIASDSVLAYGQAGAGVAALGRLSLDRSVFWQNAGGHLSPTSAQTPPIWQVDPKLRAFTPTLPMEAWRLEPAPGSPLVDAARPSRLDPDGSRADVGAYGGAGAGSLDLDGDGLSVERGDCEDGIATIPGPELPGGLDDDCDGVTD